MTFIRVCGYRKEGGNRLVALGRANGVISYPSIPFFHQKSGLSILFFYFSIIFSHRKGKGFLNDSQG
jgi:hypothetical protein